MSESSSGQVLDELRAAAVSCWRESNQARLRMLEAYAQIDRIGVDSPRLDLDTRTGRATTHRGGTLTAQQVLHLAADLNVIPAILDQDLGLVEHGRGRRLASPIQRKVIFARDRGCTFPGCNKSAGQSQVHHMDCTRSASKPVVSPPGENRPPSSWETDLFIRPK